MRRIAVIASALLAVVIVSVPVSAASGWTAPQRVWDAAYGQPSMVVDADGAAHIAARGVNGIWYLTNEPGRWTRVRLTRDGDTTSAAEPQIALDAWDGSLTVVFVVIPCPDCAWRSHLSYVTNRHPGGPGPWSSPRRIPGRRLSTPSVVVRHGVIAIAADGGVNQTDVAFLTDVTGRWTREDLRASGDRWAESPTLALDRQGRPVIAYAVHGPYPKADAIRLARGTTRTGRFATERVVATPGAQAPSLVLDAKGQSRFSFGAGGGVHEARRTTSGWRLRLVWHGGLGSQLLLGRGGQTHIVGVRDTSTPSVWFATWSSGAWQKTRLTTHPAGQPTLAVGKSPARDHVVYVVGDRLWYTHSR